MILDMGNSSHAPPAVCPVGMAGLHAAPPETTSSNLPLSVMLKA